MSFELTCQQCHKIIRALIPIVSKKDSMVYSCGECDHDVIRIFGEESLITTYIKENEKAIKSD